MTDPETPREQTRFLACPDCGCTSLQVGVIHWCTLVHYSYWIGDQEHASWSLGDVLDVDAETDDPSMCCDACGWSESLRSAATVDARDDDLTPDWPLVFGDLARAIRTHVEVLNNGTADAIRVAQENLRRLSKRLP